MQVLISIPPALRVAMFFLSCMGMLDPAKAGVGDESRQLEFFEARIRPVLIDQCYSCHSSDSESAKGGLLLDSAIGLLAGGDSGPAIVKGQPFLSPLLEAIRYEGTQMPPDGKLPDYVIADFEKWIADGAVDPRIGGRVGGSVGGSVDIEAGKSFWAFRPAVDCAVPKGHSRSPNSIDAFVTEKHAKAGLRGAPRAERSTLIRRIYFDLVGLPPAPNSIDEGVAGSSRKAVSDLIDRLLGSDQFGVHWGRHWLDVARYADSNGNDFNATFHNAWKYRDYVVDAMNDDKPFNQFVMEQLAGDLLPHASSAQRTEQLVATGFLMLGTKMLSERDKEKLRMDVVDEQVSTVGTAFLGLTLGCARCHDHKFDPIPTRDYYALAGIFRSTRTLEGESQKYVSTWPRTALPTSDKHVAEVKNWESAKKDLETQLKSAQKHLLTLEKRHVSNQANALDDTKAKFTGEWKLSSLTPTYFGKGYRHDNQTGKGMKSAEFVWRVPASSTYEVQVSYVSGGNRASNVPVAVMHAGGESRVLVDQTKSPEVDRMFSVVGRFPFEKGDSATVTVSTNGTVGYVIVDAIRFLPIDSSGGYLPDPDNNRTKSNDKLTAAQDRVASLESSLQKLKKNAPAPIPRAIAVSDLAEVNDCEICIRGEHKNRGRTVPRGFLQVASDKLDSDFILPDSESGRRELAVWIASSENPLTARVIVNRVWSQLIGEGLVRTVDNFGSLGSRPSHPQLLDHLASRFVTPSDQQTAKGSWGMGWSLKTLIREIVTSDVYQRSCDHNDQSYQIDPENILLWKANRRRLPAESLRDSMLAISGSLDLSPGGSPVKGLGTLVKSNDANADDYVAHETYRRSLYLPIIRSELPPILAVFDFANPDMVVGKRPVTNVPAQSLFLMNSPFVMANAEAAAEKICEEPIGSIRDLVVKAYRQVLFRAASESEIDRAAGFIEGSGDTSPTAELAVTRLTRLIHVMFASTEFRMLD